MTNIELCNSNQACNEPKRSNSGSDSVLSSVIFTFFSKGNDNVSKLKQNISRLVIQILHTAKKNEPTTERLEMF